jgi:hypothetical protein
LRPRDRLLGIARLAVRASQAGATALGVALLVMSDEPGLQLASLVVLALAGVGSLAALEKRWSGIACLVVSATLIAIVRREAGPPAAVAMAALLGVSAWARLCFRDVKAGLAVFGVLAVLSAGSSLRLVVAFWLVGWIVALLGYRKASRLALKTESREFRALKSGT